MVAEAPCRSFDFLLWRTHFTFRQWISNSDFHFHSSLLTSDKTMALLKRRSAPRPFISGRLAFNAKCSHGGDRTCVSGRSEGTWTKDFLYRLMLSLLPKHVCRQGRDLYVNPNAFCMCECWGAYSRSDIKDLPLLVSDQEDSRCIRELQALVRHSEPSKASTTLACEARRAWDLFQNQSDASAPLIYALQTPEAIFKTGSSQCMQGAAARRLFLPRSNNTDSFHTYLPV